jgi:hypothetical protein
VVCIIATNVAPPELLWRPNRRTHFGVWGAVRLLQLYCSDAMAPEPMHAAQVAAAPNVLFDQSKIVSRDLHRQTDSQTGQVFVQDRFLSRRWLDRPSRYIIAPPDRGRRVLAGKRLSRPATRFRNVAATRERALIAIAGRCCSGRRVVRAYLPCNSQARRRAKAAGRLRFCRG